MSTHKICFHGEKKNKKKNKKKTTKKYQNFSVGKTPYLEPFSSPLYGSYKRMPRCLEVLLKRRKGLGFLLLEMTAILDDFII